MFKNWKAICEIPDSNFRWAMALLDLNVYWGKLVITRFPEYFTEEEQVGPIPMSVLREEAKKRDGYDIDLVTDGACEKFHIPVIRYYLAADESGTGRPLPAELQSLANIGYDEGFGMVVECEGKKLVLVENCAQEALYFAPLECIAIDL